MLAPVIAPAQSAPVVDTLAEARRLRDAKEFAAAGELLRPYVEAHPDDAGSARFAALMAYWAKDRVAADTVYARALALHPDDGELRLEYAQFLVETGSSPRARAALQPIITSDSAAFTRLQVGRARTLLGTADYWAGDFVAARRQFAMALRLDSSLADARRQLTEIETAAATWVRFGTSLWKDDQPLRHATVDVEAGRFANPLTPLTIRARSTRFNPDGSSESTSSAEAGLTSYLPAAHLDLGIGGGVLQRSSGESTDWIGHAALGVRLPGTIVIQARFQREPYTNTVRSLAQSIMVRSVEGSARWGASEGWTGEALVRRDTYPDNNAVSTAYGWILAPVVRSRTVAMHVGYGFSAQSADENRFVPRGDINVPPGQVPATVAGEYNPYYTPDNLRVHSVLGSARLRPNARWTLEANARYALSARDDAPVLVAVATPPNVTVTRGFYDRSFTPWNARGSIDFAPAESVRLGLGAEHGRGAYYSFTSARLQLTYTFVAAARRRADVR